MPRSRSDSLRRKLPATIGRRPLRLPTVCARVRRSAETAFALDEVQSKALLAAYGVPIAREAVASTPAEAVAAAQRIGFPVVLKAVSAKLASQVRRRRRCIEPCRRRRRSKRLGYRSKKILRGTALPMAFPGCWSAKWCAAAMNSFSACTAIRKWDWWRWPAAAACCSNSSVTWPLPRRRSRPRRRAT